MDNIFNSEYLKKICKKYGLAPSKKYGQNFLINPEPVEKMAAAAEISQNDTVVEIGPGFGVLTFALAAKAKQVIAFEIEKKLQPYWEKISTRQIPKKVRDDNIEIIWGNVLKEFGRIASIEKKYKLVANLPYQITSEVIRKFLEAKNKPERMVLMVQKEVAERICAKPGEMSVLSVAVQYYAEPEIAAQVPRSYFWPQPKVDSAIILIKEISRPQNSQVADEFFFKIVKAGFANRRKFLIKNLSSLVAKAHSAELANIFAQIGLNQTARAQELSVAQWSHLSTYLSALIVV